MRNIGLFLIIFVSMVLCCGWAFAQEKSEGVGFEEQYKAYQSEARAGKRAVDKKDYQQAIEHYNRAIEMSRFEAANYYNRGLALFKMGNREKAKEDFDKVIILDGRRHAAYVYRGMCQMKKHAYKEALADYKKALNLKHKDPAVHNNLALLYATATDEKFQDEIKALVHALKAVELTKEKNAEALDTLARAYFANGKVKDAVETEKKAVKLAPGDEGFKERLGEYERAVKSGGEIRTED